MTGLNTTAITNHGEHSSTTNYLVQILTVVVLMFDSGLELKYAVRTTKLSTQDIVRITVSSQHLDNTNCWRIYILGSVQPTFDAHERSLVERVKARIVRRLGRGLRYGSGWG